MKGGNNVSRLLKNLVVFAMTMVTFIVLGMAAKAEEIVIDNNTVQYTVSEAAVYWESSKYGGFGKHNTISECGLRNTSCSDKRLFCAKS